MTTLHPYDRPATKACLRAFLTTLVLVCAGAAQEAAEPESSGTRTVLAATPIPDLVPRTVPETTLFERTSTAADVDAFLADLLHTAPFAGRLDPFVFGRSEEGRDLVAVDVRLQDPAAPAELTVLVVGNIHGGEVEGKEVLQILLREFAHGAHEELLQHARLVCVPIFNVDGNERIDRGNRASQNGPPAGVGERANADGFDLNRDFVKLRTAEARAMLGLMRRFDPDLLIDLHTTNGSYHGYHLTYAPSLATNVDPGLDRIGRDVLLAASRARLADAGYRAFDYGNFTRSGPRRWVTFDHKPRFLTNYFGLRNRLAVLCEAYSYCDFETRIHSTRAFVLAVLRTAVEARAELLAAIRRADALCRGTPPAFGYDTGFGTAEDLEVLVGSVDRIELPDDLGTRLVARPEFETVTMPVIRRFESRTTIEAPRYGWAVLQPTADVVRTLQVHGIAHRRLRTARPGVVAERFEVEGMSRNRREFQGVRAVSVVGSWKAGGSGLPAGTLVVPARQRLARLAAQLLEPRSEDGLTTWGYFDDFTTEPREAAPGTFPVVRLLEDPDGE